MRKYFILTDPRLQEESCGCSQDINKEANFDIPIFRSL